MEAEGKKKKSKKLILIIIIMSIVIAIGGITAVFISSGGKLSNIAKKFEQSKDYVVAMDEFVVNLSIADHTETYLKTKISLVYTDNKKTNMLSEKNSQIRDVIIKDLMGYSSNELLMAGGTDNVKKRLKTDINKALGEDVVTEIYFTDFLIQ